MAKKTPRKSKSSTPKRAAKQQATKTITEVEKDDEAQLKLFNTTAEDPSLAEPKTSGNDIRDEITAVLRQITDKVPGCTKQIDETLKKLQDTKHGISLLELKTHLILNYNMNLAYLMMLKMEGKPIAGEPVVDRLIYLRTVMEKIVPIDKKLSYQVDKLIKSSISEHVHAQEDPLQYKPKPDSLIAKEGAAESGAAEGVYVPPKISEARFIEDERAGTRRQRTEEKERRKLANSSLFKELRDQYSEHPEEIAEADVAFVPRSQERKVIKDDERKKYEEANFVRLVVGKKAKKLAPRRKGAFDDLMDFGRIGDAAERGDKASKILRKRSIRDQVKEVRSKRNKK